MRRSASAGGDPHRLRDIRPGGPRRHQEGGAGAEPARAPVQRPRRRAAPRADGGRARVRDGGRHDPAPRPRRLHRAAGPAAARTCSASSSTAARRCARSATRSSPRCPTSPSSAGTRSRSTRRAPPSRSASTTSWARGATRRRRAGAVDARLLPRGGAPSSPRASSAATRTRRQGLRHRPTPASTSSCPASAGDDLRRALTSWRVAWAAAAAAAAARRAGRSPIGEGAEVLGRQPRRARRERGSGGAAADAPPSRCRRRGGRLRRRRIKKGSWCRMSASHRWRELAASPHARALQAAAEVRAAARCSGRRRRGSPTCTTAMARARRGRGAASPLSTQRCAIILAACVLEEAAADLYFVRRRGCGRLARRSATSRRTRPWTSCTKR